MTPITPARPCRNASGSRLRSSAYRSLSTELQDCRDLIELGEEEGDQETVAEAEAQILSAYEQAAETLDTPLGQTATGTADHARRALKRDGRHAAAALACRPTPGLARTCSRTKSTPGEEAEIKVEHAADQRRERLWLAEDRDRGAPSGADFTLRPEPPPYLLRVGLGRPVVDDSIEVDILDKDLRVDTYRALRVRAGSTSTGPNSMMRITHEPTGVVVSVRTTAASIRTGRRP